MGKRKLFEIGSEIPPTKVEILTSMRFCCPRTLPQHTNDQHSERIQTKAKE